MPLVGGAGFWLALLVTALGVGLLGALIEVLLLRRLYRSPELFQLLATFALVLVVQDATLALWGPEDLLGPRAPGFSGSVVVLGTRLPEYDLVLIAAGPLVGAAIFTGLKAELISLTNLWRAGIGTIIIALVIAFPQGVVGSLKGLWEARLRGGSAWPARQNASAACSPSAT